MINQLLTLALAESGEIHLAWDAVDLSELVKSTIEQMEPVASWKHIALREQLEDAVTVTGDRSWLERVLLNLVDNAIKFTEEGGRIDVILTRKESSACLDVRDTGIGISLDAIPHIFERFYRADPSRSKQVEGAGLGLSLVRWVVEQHRGSVRVESQPGHGSCFTVRLPLIRSVQGPMA